MPMHYHSDFHPELGNLSKRLSYNLCNVVNLYVAIEFRLYLTFP